MSWKKRLFSLFILALSTTTLQAFELSSGIHVNHHKWLEYSRWLPNNLNDNQVLNSNDPRYFMRSSAYLTSSPCKSGKCTSTQSAFLGRSNVEENDTPMSLLFLKLTDTEIPYNIMKHILHLRPRDEGRLKFLSQKAVVFSYINKTALKSIKKTGKADPKTEDPMTVALFLPVEYQFIECGSRPLASIDKQSESSSDLKKEPEWPQFLTNLLKEIEESNSTAHNLLSTLFNEEESDNIDSPIIDRDIKHSKFNETSRFFKENDYPHTEVMLYYFQTPHVNIPAGFVRKILNEINVGLGAQSLSKFEVNEVYLMTVANQTLTSELKEDLFKYDKGQLVPGDVSKTTPVVLSFIIPIEYQAEKQVSKSNAPHPKTLTLLRSDDSGVFSSPERISRLNSNQAPDLSIASVGFPNFPLVTIPVLIPYQPIANIYQLPLSMPKQANNFKSSEEISENVDRLIPTTNQPRVEPAKNEFTSYQDEPSFTRDSGKNSPHKAKPAEYAPPSSNPLAYSPSYSYPGSLSLDPQRAPPATAPGGINSSFQPRYFFYV